MGGDSAPPPPPPIDASALSRKSHEVVSQKLVGHLLEPVNQSDCNFDEFGGGKLTLWEYLQNIGHPLRSANYTAWYMYYNHKGWKMSILD